MNFSAHVGVGNYDQLWNICIFVFTLSNGQAPVERGFNINKSSKVENLKEDTLVPIRLVFDEILARDDNVATLDISPELALSCQNAKRKYDDYLAQSSKCRES